MKSRNASISIRKKLISSITIYRFKLRVKIVNIYYLQFFLFIYFFSKIIFCTFSPSLNLYLAYYGYENHYHRPLLHPDSRYDSVTRRATISA